MKVSMRHDFLSNRNKRFSFPLRSYFLGFLICFFSISSSYGQSEDKLGSWYIYNGFFNLNPKVQLFF